MLNYWKRILGCFAVGLAVLSLTGCLFSSEKSEWQKELERDEKKKREYEVKVEKRREEIKKIRDHKNFPEISLRAINYYFSNVADGDVDRAEYILHYQTDDIHNQRFTWVSDWEKFELGLGSSIARWMNMHGKPIGEVDFTIRVKQGYWETVRGRILVFPSFYVQEKIEEGKPVNINGLQLEFFTRR